MNQPCYDVPSTVSVDNGGALTIAPGTVVRFGSGTALLVNQGGQLVSRGTAEKPVYLTGLQATRGYWQGVRFVFSNSVANELAYTVVEYGGGNDRATLSATGLSTSVARLKLANVTLRYGSGYGFGFDDNVELDQFDAVVATANGAPGYLSANDVGQLTATSSYAGNTNDAIRVDSTPIDRAQTWHKLDVPYLMADASADYTVRSALTIEAGTTLRFASASSLYVGQGGSLSAVGTAAKPITFTASEPTPGFWRGVRFVFTNSTSNEIRHAVVEYAGAGSGGGNVYLQGLSTSPSRLKIGSTTLRHSNTSGISLDSNVLLDEFSAMTLTGNARAATLPAGNVPSLGSDSRFTGNTSDVVYVENATVDTAATWHRLDVPYLLGDASAQYTTKATLTIEAGTTLIFGSGATLYVDQAGALSAIGTAAAPITFRGAERTPGYWRGIDVIFSNSTANVIDHASITDGGSGGTGRGNITMNGLSTSPGRLTLTNSTIGNSAAWGVYRNGSNTLLTQSGNTFTGNASGTVGP